MGENGNGYSLAIVSIDRSEYSPDIQLNTDSARRYPIGNRDGGDFVCSELFYEFRSD
jgi:hypothetical protein